jgi:hypothetical protein
MEEVKVDLTKVNQALLKAQEQSRDVKDVVNDSKFIVPWIYLCIRRLFMLFATNVWGCLCTYDYWVQLFILRTNQGALSMQVSSNQTNILMINMIVG